MNNHDPVPMLIFAVLLVSTIYVVSRDRAAVDQFKAFMTVRKRWWLGPILVMLALLGVVLILSQNGRASQLIYALF